MTKRAADKNNKNSNKLSSNEKTTNNPNPKPNNGNSKNCKNDEQEKTEESNAEMDDDQLRDDTRQQNELQRSLKELIKTTNALKESILGSEGGAELLQSLEQCEKQPEVKKVEQVIRPKLDRRKFQYDPPIKGRMSDEEIIRFNPGKNYHHQVQPI